MNILITGGSGLIGKELNKTLVTNGHQVSILSRKKSNDSNTFHWDPSSNTIELEALQWADSIVHLAGAGIVDSKWTERRKQVLEESRVKTAQLIFNTIKENNIQVKSFISASGIGFYGAETTSKIYTEEDEASSHYIGKLCVKWEQAAQKFKSLGIQVNILRTGVVLTPEGGALEKLAKPIKYGIGSPLGSGKQYIPWIHVTDLCKMYTKLIDGNLKKNTIYNAVAPEHITNQDFTKVLAKTLHRKLWMPNVPSFVLKIILGTRADLVLEGSRISCDKIQEDGFTFHYPQLKMALDKI